MTFQATTFRVLIASPSDVSEERELAVRAIQEWNDQHAADRRVVLLPLRWETHSAPEYGKRPQEVINRQIVDNCDLLVGIFWTRIGTNTGVADSGTIEEIERVATQGKQVMLYFSRAKFDPEQIDLEQLAKLREFKKKTWPTSLNETYSSAVEFKDKFARQIDIHVKKLIADLTLGHEAANSGTDIVFNLANQEGKSAGAELTLNTLVASVPNPESIPDYSSSDDVSRLPRGIQGLRPNPSYYRELIAEFQASQFFVPLDFWLKNRGSVGARDLYLDVTVKTDGAKLVLIQRSVLSGAPSKTRSNYAVGLLGDRERLTSLEPLLAKAAAEWSMTFEVRALQPQRELPLPSEYAIGALESCDVEIEAKIYADTLATPSIESVQLHIEVEKVNFDAHGVLAALDKEYEKRFPLPIPETGESEDTPAETGTL